MRIDRTFLRSKVARRIFTLFVLCALLPIAALAFLSFSQVTRQLSQQSQNRLRQAAKAMGVAIMERLLFLEGQMKVISSSASRGVPSGPLAGSDGDLSRQFGGLALLTPAGRQVPLFGPVENPPQLTSADEDYLRSGKTLLSSRASPDGPARIFMSRALNPGDPRSGILIGEINTTYLWDIGEESALPHLTQSCVLDQANIVLFCSSDLPASFLSQVTPRIAGSAVGQFEWREAGEEYLASYWSLFLQPRFRVRKWIVVLSQSKADVFAPVADFKKTFSLVVLMSLWVVLLLSISQIRRSLVPLEKLRQGTERVATRNFDSLVDVTSGDEFEELTKSFNSMAGQLGRQFHALSAMGEIDRAILASLDTRKIVDTVLIRMREVIPCDCIGVVLRDADAAFVARAFVKEYADDTAIREEEVQILPDEMQRLHENPESLTLAGEDLPRYLAPLAGRGFASVMVLPVFLKERVSAIIALGHRVPRGSSQEDVAQVRRLANQVGVALSNANLIEELSRLNWGTLTALARAIDAKSAWTAGHSERVTDLALRIGWVLGLSQKELDVLHRGGLLHDIGKIGIPPEILDKAGKLTPEEAKVMHRHARIGARILEPIAAFAEVIPIVLQHHEWFDGNGYPEGLSGEAISLGARIFAVADSYDALISDRPYRSGLGQERAVEIIKQEAGRQFDPKVVQAFLTLMDQEARPAAVRTQES